MIITKPKILTSSGRTKFFLMRGQDVDAKIPAEFNLTEQSEKSTIVYRTWVVTEVPDFIGELYGGEKCGDSPLANIAVISSWSC